MKSENIIKIYKSGIHKISKHYKAVLQDFDKEDNHDFRVEVKKLRAFIRLINLAQQDRHQKIPKSIKEFYHCVGDIRNLQLQQERINNINRGLLIDKPENYLALLHSQEKEVRKKAKQISEDISFKVFEDRLMADVPDELSEETTMVFVKNSILRLAQLLALPEVHDETFHDIRKTLKDLMYNYDYLPPAIVAMIPGPLNDQKIMESLTDVLGNFHDLSLAVLYLSTAYIDATRETNEIIIPVELEEHLLSRKEHLKNELIASLAPVKQKLEALSFT